jgi:Bacteriophage T4-like portal protein (Gp20)
MTQMTAFWKIVSPKTRKQLYTTLSTDAYDPRSTDMSSLSAVTWYSQVMKGPGSRMQSYKQYDSMDTDIDIARSLDIIAEEMSGKDDKTELPFIIQWQKEDNQDVSDTTTVTVRAALRQWAQIQDLKKRVFSTARCLIKYGDCFFRKNSDTHKWMYVDPSLVVGIEIDEMGNKVSYHVKKPSNGQSSQLYGVGRSGAEFVDVVPAAAMIHFTMCDDMGDSAPFGSSVLKPIFRVYRQLTMLEDAVIIYRIVRAPERRVFYLDVGNMNQQQVKRYLESVKNDIRQKRVPGTQTNGIKDSVDGQYDPTSLQEDYFFPVTAAGKSSRVETLPGGTEDFGTALLRQFQEKIFRGLRIPTSYLGGQEGAGAQTNDGKVGIAYIEELRFANFIGRLQDRLNEIYDQEFKIYLKVCGLRVDDEVFSLKLPDPANFALYRQAALDADLIGSFNNIQEVKFLSRRFILKRYLGLTDDEIQMNEVQIKEEKNMSENSKVPIMQQLYDDAVYANRDAVNVEADAAQPGEGGGSDEFDDEPTAGLLDTFGDEPPANNAETEAPPEEGEAPAEEPAAPPAGAPAPAAG